MPKITDFFDIKNQGHVEAFKYLQEKGHWPKDFPPDNVTFPAGWTHALNYKIIGDLLDERDRLLRGEFTPEECAQR
jgi:hypothetical protein